MRDDMDHLMARLAVVRLDRSLDGFEQAVLLGVAKRREDLRVTRALAPARMTSVVIALAIGVTAGGVAAANSISQATQLSPFSAAAHLAPSTLLEGAG